MDPVTAQINLDRMERRLDELWEIGQTSRGGVTRLAYTEEESEAIEYVLDEAGGDYAVETDSIGNVFLTREPDAPRTVFIGSHLDTVFNAGRLDGTLGVVAALEAVDAVYAAGEPACPPTIVICRGEESSRFGQHTIGSRGMLGMLKVEDFAATDQNRVPLWQAIQEAGFYPENLTEPTVDVERIGGFLETHIEQGRVLEEDGLDVGIVTGIRAPVRYRFTAQGEDDHSGATPMDRRRDALTAAAEMITTVEQLASDAAQQDDVVATVGDITAVEGAINKICGEVSFPLDLRSNDREYRDAVEERLLGELDAIADRRDVSLTREELDRSEPVDLDSSVNETLTAAAERTGVSYRHLPSGGGHDAMNFQLSDIPTGMVFVPSVEGISHNPQEATYSDSIEAAAKVLSRALCEMETDTGRQTDC